MDANLIYYPCDPEPDESGCFNPQQIVKQQIQLGEAQSPRVAEFDQDVDDALAPFSLAHDWTFETIPLSPGLCGSPPEPKVHPTFVHEDAGSTYSQRTINTESTNSTEPPLTPSSADAGAFLEDNPNMWTDENMEILRTLEAFEEVYKHSTYSEAWGMDGNDTIVSPSCVGAPSPFCHPHLLGPQHVGHVPSLWQQASPAASAGAYGPGPLRSRSTTPCPSGGPRVPIPVPSNYSTLGHWNGLLSVTAAGALPVADPTRGPVVPDYHTGRARSDGTYAFPDGSGAIDPSLLCQIPPAYRCPNPVYGQEQPQQQRSSDPATAGALGLGIGMQVDPHGSQPFPPHSYGLDASFTDAAPPLAVYDGVAESDSDLHIPTTPEKTAPAKKPKGRAQSKDKIHRCPWPGCDRASARKNNLDTHYSRVHLQQRPFPCPAKRCKKHTKGFSRQHDLTRHLEKHPEHANSTGKEGPFGPGSFA
ncbi:hypothetical protein C8Q76DRAFT_794921 [Earliella scabrosa]|nr:hypothetical protein C8Q76DRAFT_794921 [Earliella scabrosa]